MLNISYKAYNHQGLKHLYKSIDTAGWIWNHCIALQKRYYSLYGGYINVNRLQKHIARLRKNNPYWINLNSQSVQEICQRVDTAYQRFFKKIADRPPKFKKSKFFTSFVLKQSGWQIEDSSLTIQGKKYKFSKSRYYEKVKRITVKRNKLGEIFFILCCDMEPIKYKREGNSSIGMDFGLKMFLTCSDGTEIKSPEFLKSDLNEIKKAHKRFSKKKKGSNNRGKALKNLQRKHISIQNKRSDFHWKLANSLCRDNSFIAIEDLNMSGMKKLWGRKISDLAFYDFVTKLEYVAKKYDTTVQKIDRFYPSSQTCTCGVVNKDLKLSDRVWTCSSCDETHQRDLLAANNILTEGIRLWRTRRKTALVAV